MGKKVKMAAISRSTSIFLRKIGSRSVLGPCNRYFSSPSSSEELVTHTGQQFDENDYRKARFVDKAKLVNTRFAIDLIREDPVVVCENRVVFSDSGGPLGHPRVYINLDMPGVHTCGYSGRKFVNSKYYDEAQHGKSVSYEEYIEEMNPKPKDYPK